jgi:predicted esterase
MDKFYFRTQKTARCFFNGDFSQARELWYVIHGYAQGADEFLLDFSTFAARNRVIVAPEALSRFYRQSVKGVVGASWMTRVDREIEIADYLRYLNGLHREISGKLAHEPQQITVIAFSQGVATLARWLAVADFVPDETVFWAGTVPPELDFTEFARRINSGKLHLVAGNQDKYIDPEKVSQQKELLDKHGILYTVHRFDGGHEINQSTLKKILRVH